MSSIQGDFMLDASCKAVKQEMDTKLERKEVTIMHGF